MTQKVLPVLNRAEEVATVSMSHSVRLIEMVKSRRTRGLHTDMAG